MGLFLTGKLTSYKNTTGGNLDIMGNLNLRVLSRTNKRGGIERTGPVLGVLWDAQEKSRGESAKRPINREW